MVKTRREVLRRLAHFSQQHGSEFGLRRIGVFGSAARDRLTQDSDVDVVHYRPRMNAVLKQPVDAEAIYAS